MRFSRSLKTVALELGVILALAVGLELVLRVVAPEYGHKVFDNEYTGSYPLAYNADDYRGPRVPKLKPAGEFRVVALGDSETLGTGLPWNKTWPAQLEDVLNRRGRRTTVINGGLEGNSLADIELGLREKWQGYSPDRVVLALTSNMVALCAVGGKSSTPEQRLRKFHEPLPRLKRLSVEANRLVHLLYLPSFASIESQRVLYLWGLLNHNIDPAFPVGTVLAYGWQQGDLPPGLADESWGKLAREVERIRDDATRAGAQLLVIWLPPRFDISDSFADNEKNVQTERFTIDPHARIRQIADQLGVKLVDMLPALREARQVAARQGRVPPLYIHFDYAHFDEQGSGVVARAAADAL